MKAWIYDDLPGSPSAPHDSGRAVSAADLEALGVHYSFHPTIDTVNDFAASRRYRNRDTVNISRAGLGDLYDSKLAIFFEEHLHEDEEIRYIEDGVGYFDVRGAGEEWVRVLVEKGDLLVLPPGIWHRFTVDEGEFVRAVRLFQDEPKWTPLKREPEMEENQVRREYVEGTLKKVQAAQ